jgi:uncharacterized protein (DUF2147 family)
MRSAVAVFLLGAMLAPASSVLAAGPSPIGQWELASGESRFIISYCGSGKQLCARLTWLRDDARTDTNLKLLNREVVSHAVPSAENAWEGQIRYDGESYQGTVKLISENAMRVESCSGIFCRSFELNRI